MVFGTVVKLVVSFFAAVFVYLEALLLSLSLGDTNPVARLAQLALALTSSLLSLGLMWKRVRRAWNRRVFIWVVAMGLASFAPVGRFSGEGLGSLTSLVLLFLPLMASRLSMTKPALPQLVTPFFANLNFIVYSCDSEGVKLKGVYSAMGFGFNKFSATRRACAAALGKRKPDEYIFPVRKNFVSDKALAEEEIEVLYYLGLMASRRLVLAYKEQECEGVVDCLVERKPEGLSLSVLCSKEIPVDAGQLGIIEQVFNIERVSLAKNPLQNPATN